MSRRAIVAAVWMIFIHVKHCLVGPGSEPLVHCNKKVVGPTETTRNELKRYFFYYAYE